MVRGLFIRDGDSVSAGLSLGLIGTAQLTAGDDEPAGDTHTGGRRRRR